MLLVVSVGFFGVFFISLYHILLCRGRRCRIVAEWRSMALSCPVACLDLVYNYNLLAAENLLHAC